MILVGILLFIVATIVGIIFWCLNSYVHTYGEDQVSAGIYIEETNLEGMIESQVIEVIDEMLEEKGTANITLITTQPEESEIVVSLSELGLVAGNQDELLETIMNYGKEGNLLSRYRELNKLEKTPVVYMIDYEIDSTLISEFVNTTYAEMIVSAVDASLEYTNGSLVVTGGTDGEKIDIDDAILQIEAFMSDDWNGESGQIDLVTMVVEPDIAAESLENVTDVLGTYETYCAENGNRWNNVARATELISGTILEPGEEFSVAAAIQPITEDNGYASAGAYQDGEVVSSIGGGVCQASSTLYNAVLYAELDITQRNGHSMLVSYVDPARDAAIAGDYKDLKFLNDTDSNIYIYGELSGTTLTFTIFGEETRDENRTISFTSVETQDNGYGDAEYTENSELSLGTINKTSSGYRGVVAELWKKIYIDGELEEEVKVTSSTYSSSPIKYEVGTSSDYSEASAIVSAAIKTQDEDKIDAAITEAKALIVELKAEEAAAEAEASEEQEDVTSEE